ncbi:unnamed protein product [Moneuplotes crassus]|uniref:Uncharacterized protein n=1 Tax=Euplotes crassus TaxID=5936 RepID=A0AAD2D3B5_EUPCR|nr:unnamed protein product [Moneuplotes crassus]
MECCSQSFSTLVSVPNERKEWYRLEKKMLTSEHKFHKKQNLFHERYLALSLYQEDYYEIHFDEEYLGTVFIKKAKGLLRYTDNKKELAILLDNKAMKNKYFRRYWSLGNSKFETIKLWPRRFDYSIPDINPYPIFPDLIRVLSGTTKGITIFKMLLSHKKLISILSACSQSDHAFFMQCDIVGSKVNTQIKGHSKLKTLRLLKRGNHHDYMWEPTYVNNFLHCASLCPCREFLQEIFLENMRLDRWEGRRLKKKYGFSNAKIKVKNMF